MPEKIIKRENVSIHVSRKKHGEFWDILLNEKEEKQGIGDYILCELKKCRGMLK